MIDYDQSLSRTPIEVCREEVKQTSVRLKAHTHRVLVVVFLRE